MWERDLKPPWAPLEDSMRFFSEAFREETCHAMPREGPEDLKTGCSGLGGPPVNSPCISFLLLLKQSHTNLEASSSGYWLGAGGGLRQGPAPSKGTLQLSAGFRAPSACGRRTPIFTCVSLQTSLFCKNPTSHVRLGPTCPNSISA